ncbi:MAG: NAD-dependent succinate-semialdehyde dehydrogenase [Gammaproteobacteria bacterium]|jgi:succinate-semialdehyde dehydrogenase/glutarate-semialdehyde dehydrogenase|nr:NAD-dependent succinate-semialdehyde dehydrogenase [Gammaproteobacteria bacterium]MBT3859337.1 NAD-dependent succinate-semialdehyde dehydrogenase [Gammaproteobacteria bacterium]MBT3986862.1 NAD-dependent succinate-semialdehyde dehydrogenase [Gammaproteobacteria bacterium]MBT4255797.1 NAD-dependent succinate-semialdehyde dehydrogenase [Gammaproteobacteria bacterium]MBT4581949.1 NAD-dependent succinate-semialdehyde dehydrogenase [Gammaproteobacteria bacterium]
MLNLQDTALFRTENYINGQWKSGSAGSLEVFNPSTGESIAKVANGDAVDTEAAVEAAALAFKTWSRTPAKQRASLLRRWYELVLENADDLGALMTAEQGKPLPEAVGEINYGAEFIEFYAEECKRISGSTIPTVANDRRLQTYKQAVGVVGCITPWNFPSAMITRKAAPAMAAGCTVVIKPDAGTPLSALALCELADRAGIPPGVINVVVGSDAAAIGKVLTQHPKVAKFTFTGSTAIGRILMAQCASTVKKISLELGGNAPYIVFDDADIDEAVAHCIATKFRNCGQTCVCTNRIYVQSAIEEEFSAKLKTAISEVVVADGFTEGAIIGPMINMQAVEKMDAFMKDAVEKGVEVLLGGGRHQLGENFYQPTLLRNISDDMRIAGEEIFGPIAALQTFETEEEVIAKANDTEYGLAAYFFTRDVGRVMRVSENLEYGIVCSNSGVFSTEVAPFGGWKQSGIGSEGGHEGILDFYETKFHSMGGIER